MRLATLAAVAAGTIAAAAPTAAHGDAHVPWTDPLPPTTSSPAEYRYDHYNALCRDDAGIDTFACVDATIAEMDRRYRRLYATCDHRGLFALAYLRTTEEYRRAALTDGFFEDTPWVNHEDTVFAHLYFDAFDDWQAGRHAEVPEAWRIAFRAADEGSVTGTGDVLLGISSHINRDLPYTLAVSGLFDADPDRSRKPDHDRVNGFLARVPDPLFRELRAEWDPSIAWFGGPQTTAALALVQEWREAAWRFAERLVEARTDAERAGVERAIEEQAAEWNRSIVRATATESNAARDAFCRERHRGASALARR